MQAAVSSRSINSYLYKMDNVLYEVKDQNGILKNDNYDSWKQGVIDDLAISGYIKPEGDKFVITPEGREVIKQDSFLYNNKNIQSDNPATETWQSKQERIFKQKYLIVVLTMSFLPRKTV